MITVEKKSPAFSHLLLICRRLQQSVMVSIYFETHPTECSMISLFFLRIEYVPALNAIGHIAHVQLFAFSLFEKIDQALLHHL